MTKEKKSKELYNDPRWNTYQPVKLTNIHIELNEKDKKTSEDFKNFIDKKIKKEESTKKNN